MNLRLSQLIEKQRTLKRKSKIKKQAMQYGKQASHPICCHLKQEKVGLAFYKGSDPTGGRSKPLGL